MELRTKSTLYWLWASTYRLFWREPPIKTDTCAVWRRIIGLPVIWPSGLFLRLGALIMSIIFLILFFLLGYTVGLFTGYYPAMNTVDKHPKEYYWTWKKYRGWFAGPFELYPWHILFLIIPIWGIWIGWYGYVHWMTANVPHGLFWGFWLTVAAVTVGLCLGIVKLVYLGLNQMLDHSEEWWESFHGQLCHQVTIVDDRPTGENHESV